MTDDLVDRRKADVTAEELRRFDHAWKADVDLKLDKLDRRTASIERLIWISTGGVIVISAIFATAFLIYQRQSLRVDDLVSRVAVTEAKIVGLERDVQRLHPNAVIPRH